MKTNLGSTKHKLRRQSLNEYPLADPVQLTSLEIIVRVTINTANITNMRVRSLIGRRASLLVTEDVWDEFKDFGTVHYRSVKPSNPQISRTDETRTFEEEFPSLIWVTVHH